MIENVNRHRKRKFEVCLVSAGFQEASTLHDIVYWFFGGKCDLTNLLMGYMVPDLTKLPELPREPSWFHPRLSDQPVDADDPSTELYRLKITLLALNHAESIKLFNSVPKSRWWKRKRGKESCMYLALDAQQRWWELSKRCGRPTQQNPRGEWNLRKVSNASAM